MSRFTSDLRRVNGWVSVLCPAEFCSRAVLRCAFWLIVLCVGWAAAFAQTGCRPYTANYPCIYVANLGVDQRTTDSTVSAINASANSVLSGPIPVSSSGGNGATAIAVTPNNAFTYVALKFRNAIAVINNSTNSMTATFQLAAPSVVYSATATQIVFGHDGAFAWVTVPSCYGSIGNCGPSIQAIDTSTINNASPTIHTVATGNYAPLQSPEAIVLSLDGTKAYVADSCTFVIPTGGTQNSACIDVIDTANHDVTNQIQLPALPNFSNASIAITPDGSLVCMSIQTSSSPLTYGVDCLSTSDDKPLPLGPTFSQEPTSNYGMGITRDGTLYLATSGGIVLVNTADQTPGGVLQVVALPTGIAVAPDGTTVYVTDSEVNIVSILKGGIRTGSIPNVGNQPQGIAIMPSLPPTIVTQPADQTINTLQSATLSVTATGTPPLTYQWYQGQSGDTSTPIRGATGSSYTTPTALPPVASYWVAVDNPVTNAQSITTQSATATIMATLTPPTIVTQPADQTIGPLQSATLSVIATGTPPLTYQWYQGQSGDTSTPILGATSSFYTTPAALAPVTSYWVAIGNPVTRAQSITVQSATATVMATITPPTCTLSLKAASSFLTIVGNASCTDTLQPLDPLQQSLVTSLTWGVGAPDQTNIGTLVSTRTLTPATVPYTVTVTSTSPLSKLTGSATADLFIAPTKSAFAGQTVNVSITVPGQTSGAPILKKFECTLVTDSSGRESPPSSLGISCDSNPEVITLGQNPQSVTISIHTTGSATGTATTIAQNVPHDDSSYALLFPFSALLWLGAVRRAGRAPRTGFTSLYVLVSGVMLLLSTSCGGGFKAPPKVTLLSTPPGNYQITIKDVLCSPETCTKQTGFVQTTLIVPLTVSPTQ